MAFAGYTIQRGMSHIEFAQGDLLEAPEEFIAHQCNCTGLYPKGLAKRMGTLLPYADPYAIRRRAGLFKGRELDSPGNIRVYHGPNESDRKVICMFAQYHGGPPSFGFDDSRYRMTYFKSCLERLARIRPERDIYIAMPFGIGCGSAQGAWPEYLLALEDFARKCPRVNVTLYKNGP